MSKNSKKNDLILRAWENGAITGDYRMIDRVANSANSNDINNPEELIEFLNVCNEED